MEKAVFLDTMIYLHFRAVEEVNWREVVSASRVCIVIPRITIRELDKHKDSHTTRKIRERARRVLKKIEEWAQAEFTEIRTGVQVKVFAAGPSFSFEAYDLDPQQNDDVLIASALEFGKRNPKQPVVLVTQDTTPSITARGLGIQVFRLPEEMKLPTEPDPIELENQELRKRINKLESALPKLTLGFSGTSELSNRFVHRIGFSRSTETRILEKLEAERAKYPPLRPEPMLGALGYSDSEKTRYERERVSYFEEYRKYLEGEDEREKRQQRIVRLTTAVQNVGTALAEDIDVELHFDQALHVFRGSDFETRPLDPPQPPKRPRTTAQFALDAFTVERPWSDPSLFSNLISQKYQNVEPPNVSRLAVRQNIARWHVRRLKHGYRVDLEEIAVVFDDLGLVSNFTIEFHIHTASLPDQTIGKLHVIVERGG